MTEPAAELSTILDQIRSRATAADDYVSTEEMHDSLQDVPKLLDVVDAILAQHAPIKIAYMVGMSTSGESIPTRYSEQCRGCYGASWNPFGSVECPVRRLIAEKLRGAS